MKKAETKTQTGSLLEASIPQDTKIVPHVTEIGEVIYVGDGICKIKGLPNARIDDMVRIEAKGEEISALILGLNQDLVETVVLGDFTKISKGDLVKSSRRRVTIPVGESVLGRVINPLGHPVDGKGEIQMKKTAPIEVPAPSVNQREQIKDQVRTGVLVVDSIIPVGQGQRELVIGDRKTGKTTLLTNIINNQAGRDMYCVYVSIGGKKAKIKGILENLEKAGSLAYTVVVLATADDPPSLNYIAPYAGCAIGEYFMYQGKNAIVIYDDLSKQAKSYRQMSLLLKRSPGRDAYPGDIFFLHSRLLERAARLSKELGGGSLTAFPVAETQNGDISEYITTNLMSITDGHIYADANLMHSGVLPAVDSQASVSRIGGSIQTKFLRKLSELAASQLQRYNEVKSYENINTEITEETEREIKRGKRILEIFSQPSAMCYTLEEEVILLYIVTQGKLDDMELPDVKKIKKEIINYIRKEENKGLREIFGTTDKGLDDVQDELDKVLTVEFLQALATQSADQMPPAPIQEKKELNQKGLDTPIDITSRKGGIPTESPKKNAAPPPLEPGELHTKPYTPEQKEPEKQEEKTEQAQPAEPVEKKEEVKTPETPKEIPEETKQGETKEVEPAPIEVPKESPIKELGEVVNNIPDDEPPIKVINI